MSLKTDSAKTVKKRVKASCGIRLSVLALAIIILSNFIFSADGEGTASIDP